MISTGSLEPRKLRPSDLARLSTVGLRDGDPSQTGPIIAVHGVINITPANGGVRAGAPHDVTGECSEDLAQAQIESRAADPIADPHGPDQAKVVKFASCKRAAGVPNYPYPQGHNADGIGTGVDPDSPSVEEANEVSGKHLDMPAWWVDGYGPREDITVARAGLPTNPPPCADTKTGCGADGEGGNGVPVPGSGGTGADSGAGANG
ncbi:MAG: hypothetical protein ACRDJU_06320 [Actinomycetota bacterium]